jgi:hypothetical protein
MYWIIDTCLTSSEQYFSYIYEKNKSTNKIYGRINTALGWIDHKMCQFQQRNEKGKQRCIWFTSREICSCARKPTITEQTVENYCIKRGTAITSVLVGYICNSFKRSIWLIIIYTSSCRCVCKLHHHFITDINW